MTKKSLQVLLYMNQVYLNEVSGQSSFERGLTKALTRRCSLSQETEIQIFTVHPPHSNSPSHNGANETYYLLLDKSTYRGYLAHQLKLFWAGFVALWKNRKNNVTIYFRYNPAMISPVLLSILFRRRLVFRTGPVFQSMAAYRPDLKKWVYFVVYPWLWLCCRRAVKIITVTNRISHLLIQSFGFIKDKIVVIPNGTDVNKFVPTNSNRKFWGLSDQKLTFGFVGSLKEVQGLHVVIKALAEIRERLGVLPQVLVVGDGPKRREYEQLAINLKVNDCIQWAGRRPQTEIPSAISTCDIMLMPLTRQTISERGTSGMKLFEYLACDRPVMASRCEDLLILEKYDVGTLVEADNIAAWASAIMIAMEHSPEDFRLKGRARQLVLENFTFDAIADKFWDVCFN